MSSLRSVLSSTATRLSLIFLLLFFINSVGLVFYVTSLSTQIIEAQAKTAIDQQLVNLEEAFERAGIPGLIRFVDREARQPGAHLYLIADQSGRIVTGNVSAVDPGILDRSGWAGKPFSYSRFDDESATQYRAIAQVLRLPNGLTLLVGRDLGDAELFGGVVKNALMLALGFMMLGALVIWLLIGRNALKRIDGVSIESQRIIAGDLSRRLPVGESGDEFDRLALSLNGLLDRIETLDNGVRDVSNNVAHDLKTPLTRLLARSENALTGKSNAKALKSALQSNVEETQALIRTFNAILTISKLEAGSLLVNREVMLINPILADIKEMMEPAAEEQGLTLIYVSAEPVELAINRELIVQSVINLIENALNHAGPDNTKIEMGIMSDKKDWVEITISDCGVGIADQLKENATERFVRLDPSRNSQGSGLGLSLVKAIAEAHGGTLNLSDNNPGLRATMLLPKFGAR